MVISESLYNAVSSVPAWDTGDSTIHSVLEMPKEFLGVVHDERILDVWDSADSSPVQARCIWMLEKRIVRVDFKYWNGHHVTYAE